MITTNNQAKKKPYIFFKRVLIYFVIFTVLLIPVNLIFGKVGESRIFSGTENLMSDMDYVINSDSPFFKDYKDSKRVNVLLLGINGGLTDTIMLASYDMKAQKVDVISIPRDTYYYRPGYKSPAAQKINAIYRNDGAAGTASAVSEIWLGMPINYYAVIDYEGVGNIVDTIGGVPVDIPFHMHYEDPYDKPPLYIDFKKGPLVLDGKDAVKFLRYRKGYPEGDIGRVKAQQEFVKSAFKESLGFGLPKVAKSVLENVDSDLSLGMAAKIAKNALGLTSEDITTYMTPGESKTVNTASYWFADEAEIENIIKQIYEGVTEEETVPEN